jgi:hypothetical protein
MSSLVTRKFDLEVSNSPQFVECFITYISPDLKRMSNNKEEFLISIPSKKISFCILPSATPMQVASRLEEQSESKEWIGPLSSGIINGIASICRELKIQIGRGNIRS